MASPSRPSAPGHDSERIPLGKAKSKANGNRQSVSKPPMLEQAKASRNHPLVSKSPDRKRAKLSQSQHSALKTLETKGEKRRPNGCSPAASSSRSLTAKGAQSENVRWPSQASSSSGLRPTSHNRYQPVESNEKISRRRAKNLNKNAKSKLSSVKRLSLDAQCKTLDRTESVKEHKENNKYSSDLEEDEGSSLEFQPLSATTPASNTNPPSPSACISSFSDLTLKMVKSLQIEIQTPPPPILDLVFDDILIDSANPVHMAMLPLLLCLVKESWKKPGGLKNYTK
ncbi:hypothetical protein JRQ81_016292 [Phrynocephalus forsythii]|uniref:Uncharacterized protein n=1 Tax=Phrynocephalus forsythii TaxID=171643 RepID=A0A9Q0XVK0_9SAUR|nr:hypothetical protein JRQ81_016292 [Phrynocephalus forsythii]